jgi:hypothetical protein
MQRLILISACAAALIAAPAMAQTAKAPAEKSQAAKAEPTKTATGTITAISGSSVTVKTGTGDMTFNIDQKTRVIEPGGGTKNRAAQAEGKSGATASDLLKAGQSVEVKYHETGMHAASIRSISKAAADAAAAPGKAQTATGTVSSVSGSSLTIKAASGDMTFAIDPKTNVVGTGVGSAARKVTAEGGKATITEFVKEGDTVSVTYHEAGGTNTASAVRITRKKM